MYCEVALEGEGKKGREGGGRRGSCCVWGGKKLRFPGWKETAKYICESGSRGGGSWWYSAITVKRERRSCCCGREGWGLSRRGRPVAD